MLIDMVYNREGGWRKEVYIVDVVGVLDGLCLEGIEEIVDDG